MKPGDKIVRVKEFTHIESKNLPKMHEPVTFHGYCNVHKGCIDISEYLFDFNGLKQSFGYHLFRPLDEVLSEISLSEVQECLTREFQEK